MPSVQPAAPRRLRSWMPVLATCGLACLLLMPFAATPIPPLLDYPDHVAEMFVIARTPSDPVLASVYSIHWSIVANSGVELLMPPLLRWLPLWPTGEAFLILSLLLPLAGAAVFSRAVFRQWSAWPLASGLVAYNALFLLGFMNFQIGIGCAFLAAAAWVALRNRAPIRTILAGCAVTVALFFVHLFGLAFFALLVGAHELTALIGPPGRRWPGLGVVIRRLLPDALMFVAPAVLVMFSRVAGPAGAVMRHPLNLKLGELFYPFLTYYQMADRLVAGALLATMAGLLIWRRARIAPQAAVAIVVLMAAWPFVPHVYKDTGYIDARFPIIMGFLLFAGFAPVRLPRRVAQLLAGGVAIAMVVRIGMITDVWRGHTADLAELQRVMAHVEPGSQVLAVDVPSAQVIPYWRTHRRNWLTAAFIKTYYHLPALLVTERHAFWPRLFTGAGKQPVIVNPAYAGFSAPEGELPDYHEVLADQPTPQALAEAPYLEGWHTKFGYVLLVAAGAAEDLGQLRPDRLALIERTEFAALYRILPPSPTVPSTKGAAVAPSDGGTL